MADEKQYLLYQNGALIEQTANPVTVRTRIMPLSRESLPRSELYIIERQPHNRFALTRIARPVVDWQSAARVSLDPGYGVGGEIVCIKGTYLDTTIAFDKPEHALPVQGQESTLETALHAAFATQQQGL